MQKKETTRRRRRELVVTELFNVAVKEFDAKEYARCNRVVSTRLLLELDCFCLPNIVTKDKLRHKILLPRTFLATSKLLPSTFSATSKLLPSTFVATNKFNLLSRSAWQQLACC